MDHFVALNCSKISEVFAKWSLKLWADKVVEFNYFNSISHKVVYCVLKIYSANVPKL